MSSSPTSSATPLTLSSSAVSASEVNAAKELNVGKQMAMPVQVKGKLDERLAEVASSQSASMAHHSSSSDTSSKPGLAKESSYGTPAHGSVHLDIDEASAKSSGTLPYDDQEEVEMEISGAMPKQTTSTTSPTASSQNSKTKSPNPNSRAMPDHTKSGAMPALSSSGPQVYYIGNSAKKHGNETVLPIATSEEESRQQTAGSNPPLVQCTVPLASCTAGSSNCTDNTRAPYVHTHVVVDNVSTSRARASSCSSARLRPGLCGRSPSSRTMPVERLNSNKAFK